MRLAGCLAMLMVMLNAQSPDTSSVGFRVRAEFEITLTSEVAARVVERPVARGSMVKAGTVLFVLDATFIRLDLQRAEAARDAARARATFAEKEVLRQRGLVERGSGLPADLDRLELELALARSELLTRDADVQEMRERLDRTRIRAPRDGMVTELLPEVGEWVAAQARVAELITPRLLVAEAFIEPRVARRIAADDELELRSADDAELRLRARLIERGEGSTGDHVRCVLRLVEPPASVLTGDRLLLVVDRP